MKSWGAVPVNPIRFIILPVDRYYWTTTILAVVQTPTIPIPIYVWETMCGNTSPICLMLDQMPSSLWSNSLLAASGLAMEKEEKFLRLVLVLSQNSIVLW